MSDITSHVHDPVPFEGPAPTPRRNRRLRLWPALVIIGLQWAIILTFKAMHDLPQMLRGMTLFMGPMAGAFLILLWWMFFSRVRWIDRFIILGGMVSGIVALLFLADAPNPLSKMSLIMSGLSIVTLLWVGWLLVSFALPWTLRVLVLFFLILQGWAFATLERFEGISGDMTPTYAWRWWPTSVEKAPAAAIKVAETKDVITLQPGDWPAFRGPNRDGKLTGVRIATDWDKVKPKEVWRRPVGPGWGSFAVIGNRIYTQEQRGEFEMVMCYAADSGNELWAYQNKELFTEALGGPGPRATPTFHDGKIYALGARGTLDCLDAGTGKAIWSKDIKADSKGEIPMWGFSSSPLVHQGLVIVFAGGPNESKQGYVVAYDQANGALKWMKETGKLSYSSPQLVKLHGEEQVLLTSDFGVTSFHPTLGNILWQYDWSTTEQQVVRCVQPALVGDNDVLLGTGMDLGTQRFHVSKDAAVWKTNKVWMTRTISPYYNDFVVHNGHLYGFDKTFFTCVNLEDGKSKWRVRGYANGQVLLLADQDLLVVLAESGKLALVEAKPDEFKQLASFQALSGNEKTWNHPVIAHGKLYVRNSAEAMCYQLTEISAGGK